MREPPDRRTPPILLMRPAYDWISRVNQRQRELAQHELSVEQRERLNHWIETEFVYSTIALEGANVDRNRVATLASAALNEDAVAENDQAAVSLLESLRRVTSLTRARGRAAEITVDLLVELHNPSDPAVLPERARAALDTACRWFSADSFAELHPIEQAAIVLLRLIELQPFDQFNERTALVAASLFTLRSELPPIIVRPQSQIAYRAALDEGNQMNTKPMVELVAESVDESLSETVGRFR